MGWFEKRDAVEVEADIEDDSPFQPLVSVVINNYNYGRYLHSAIGSALRQTYKNTEVIVVDDGSTDHSPEVIASFGDAIVPILTENNGQAGAVNTATSVVRGDYVAFLDADDYWLPQKIETMVRLAAKKSDAGLLYHRYLDTNLEGSAIAPPAPHTLISGNFRSRYMRSGGSYWHPVMSTLMIKRELLQKIVPIPTYPNREGADSILTDCSMLMSEIASSGEVLTYRRMHGANLYGTGREGSARAPDIREGDIRRIEWRVLCVRQVLARHGLGFNVDLHLNEWYQINRYMLNQTSWLSMARSSLRNTEHGLASRYERLKWITNLKRSGVG